MKYILKMAFRNIGRNKRRTILSSIAISIAVMIVLLMRGYIGGVVDAMFDAVTKIDAGHIKLEHSKYHDKEDMMPLEHKIDGFDGGGYKQLIPVLESVKGVKTVAPRIKFGVLLSFNGKSRSALGMGINPTTEGKIISFGNIMVEGKYLEADENAKTIIIGNALADRLGIKPGDKLTILARTAYDSLRGMTFSVTGIFQYGISSLDDRLFYIPIGSAARLLEMGDGVSELVLMVDKPENAEKIADEIRDKLQQHYVVVPWQKQGGYLGLIRSIQPVYNIIYIGLLVLASTVIINTTMMVIYERIREIGTIGALGMTSGQIVLLFTIEAAIVSAIGSFLGTVVGGGLDLLLSIVGVDINALSGGSRNLMSTDIIYPRFDLLLLLWSFLFGVIIASAVAYIPARRAAKVEPVEALRSI
ncbi:ABC transporter permease [Candidatus Poribacteria bacterium]|nr:ABC transporter permease [Candidatus Poribacteria bacterium]